MTLGGEFSSRLTFGAPPASDAAAWIQGRLQGFLWSKQLEIVQALVEHRRVAVVAGHGVGKSWLAARQVAHWIESHPVGSAFAFTSAPSQTQVSAVLFRELRRAHRAGGLRGRITGGAVPTWMIGDEMVAMGRKSADASDADQAAASLQGLHAQHMLGVIDEAGGVPEWLWSAVGSLTSSSTSRLLAIGNPAAGSHFEKVCAPGSGWHVIRVSVFDSPAFTGERVPPAVLESLVTREWVDELERDYGRDSPVFQAKALALFPETREDALISPVWLTRAHQRAGREIASGSVGLDVARSGGDRSVAYINRGGVVRRRFVHRGDDLMKTAGKLIADLRDNLHSPPVPIEAIIDITGIGAGVFDRVREVEVPAVPFVAAERARDPRRFINKRAEIAWRMREAFSDGLIDLDPDDDDLAAQLGALRFEHDSKGRIKLESKDSMRARGVASPDHADAVAMTFATEAWRPPVEWSMTPDEVAAHQLRLAIEESEAYWSERRWGSALGSMPEPEVGIIGGPPSLLGSMPAPEIAPSPASDAPVLGRRHAWRWGA